MTTALNSTVKTISRRPALRRLAVAVAGGAALVLAAAPAASADSGVLGGSNTQTYVFAVGSEA